MEYADRQTLWNAVEKAESGKKAQLAYSFDIALQNEFSLEENIALARQFLVDGFVSQGTVSGNTADSNVRYSTDKPNDCKFCYYRQGRKKGCLMGEQNCAYLIREEEPAERSRCDGCPYGKYSPCIGWCTVDVINAVFKNWLAARADRERERSP